jgi:hypothetical protein
MSHVPCQAPGYWLRFVSAEAPEDLWVGVFACCCASAAAVCLLFSDDMLVWIN